MIDMIFGLLGSSAQSIPMVAKVLGIVVVAAGVLSGVISALVGVAHGVVGILKAIGAVSKPVADQAVKVDVVEQKAEGFMIGKVLPILDRLSLIPLPKVK